MLKNSFVRVVVAEQLDICSLDFLILFAAVLLKGYVVDHIASHIVDQY